MQKKSPLSVICIDSVRSEAPEPPQGPQPVASKPKFHGNPGTYRSVVAMFWIWSAKVSRFYKIPPHVVDDQIREALATRRREAAPIVSLRRAA